jgi:hypothetical protein
MKVLVCLDADIDEGSADVNDFRFAASPVDL